MTMSYAIVKTGGKQYRVEPGQSLLVERLPVDGGAEVQLEPLLYVDGASVVDSDVLSNLSTAYVDLVVDDHARPHIAYVSAKDGKVKYATRFDR